MFKKLIKAILPTNLEELYLNYRDQQMTQEEFFKVLLKNKNRIDKQYLKKRSLLIWASYVRDLETIEYLLQLDAKVNTLDYKDRSALHWAVHWGDLNIVKLLVEHGADINQKDQNQNSPLDYAQFHQHYDILNFSSNKRQIHRRSFTLN